MNSFIDYLNKIDEIKKRISSEECDFPLFRGNAKNSWQLLPTLLRITNDKGIDPFHLEAPFFHDFVSQAGNKITSKNSWEVLFLMRHYGIPTRLLDWTENLFVALYFALLDTPSLIEKPCIWILNPFKLNGMTDWIEPFLINPEYEFKNEKEYFDIFCKESFEPKGQANPLKLPNPIALYPFRQNERIISQSGLFTMHGTTSKPLEEIAPDAVYKIIIPDNLIDEITRILQIGGYNKYSIYRDLDSLSAYLKGEYLT